MEAARSPFAMCMMYVAGQLMCVADVHGMLPSSCDGQHSSQDLARGRLGDGVQKDDLGRQLVLGHRVAECVDGLLVQLSTLLGTACVKSG